jgi:glycosidase
MRVTMWIGLLGVLVGADAAGTEALATRGVQDEVIYFLLPDRFANADTSNDRGGLKGDRLVTGFDPTSKTFYHGGDLAGVLAQLDYIQALGATAIWLAPVFKNKPVQGAPGHESAGYHGYWVTDFTRVDPHFGDERQLHALVDAAHARGMKVFLDIIANHTADVIAYRECGAHSCPYRSRAEYPRKTYTPYVPSGAEHVKVPEWLNDTSYYHNRGDSTFAGESAELGDFSGLDDLATENPRVVQGFIEIFGAWIDRFRIDGYRIDTARHVNAEFWQAFIPAMQARAAANGIAHFYIFGEVATTNIDVAQLARYTRVAKFPAVLDFGFAHAVRATVSANAGTDVLARLFADDALYEGGEQTARQLPTFIGNHDMGRFASFVRADRPDASDGEVLKRTTLAYAMLMTLRGVPVIYYGDEQGFVGSGGDQDARQDMFASRVPAYLADRRIGIDIPGINGQGASASPPPGDARSGAAGARGAPAAFDQRHPLYRAIAQLAALRASHAAFRGGKQIVRNASDQPGLFAVSRLDPQSEREIVVAFNTGTTALRAFVEVNDGSRRFAALHGECEPAAAEAGVYPVKIPPLDFIVCAAEARE